MALKRTFDKEDHQNNEERDLQSCASKRRYGDLQEAEEIKHLKRFIGPYLEPIIRKSIKEEFQEFQPRLQVQDCTCRCRPSGLTSGGRALQLCFVNQLPNEDIFTMHKVKARGGGSLKIELRHAASQQRVVKEQVSTMSVQICVLHGDFGDDGNEDWTADEFNAQIVKPRETKGPLLKGDTITILEQGVAYFDNIMFTDNSCATRSGKFLLGVKILQPNSVGVGTAIREGRSEAFKVKDKRGEEYKKHDRPSLSDEVWRLKHVGKGGPVDRKLSSIGIKTVKDLLREDTTGSSRERLGKIKAWDKIITHAKACPVDDYERYIYEYRGPEKSILVSLVFNCIYEVVDVIFQGQPCRSLQSLNSDEKLLVERVKLEAYKNLQDLKQFTQEASYTAPNPGTWASTSTPIYGDAYNALSYYDQLRALQGEGWSLDLYGGEQMVPESAYSDDVNEIEQFRWEHQYPDSFFYDGASRNNPFFQLDCADYTSSKKKSKTVWQKVRNALKWPMLYMASKRQNLIY